MRILLIASSGDIQTASWIRQLHDAKWDIHLFDPQHGLISSELRDVTVHTAWRKPEVPEGIKTVYRWPFSRGRHFIQEKLPWIWMKIVPESQYLLKKLIADLKPDCIHALGMQIYGYTLYDTIQLLGGKLYCPWIYSCKGHDIYYWRDFPEHRRYITNIIGACQYYACNGERDVRLAREYGFKGEVLGFYQGMGGFPISEMHKHTQGTTSSRRTIAVKGLHHETGRALVALKAVELCADLLRDHKIRVYQAHPAVRTEVKRLFDKTGMDIECFGGLPIDMWNIFGESRIALGVNYSDGIPNAMIESMIMGAFPVQTNPGGITTELIQDRVNGILIPPDDPQVIALALQRALQDDGLVDRAAEINAKLTAERYDEKVVKPKVLDMYQYVVSSWKY